MFAVGTETEEHGVFLTRIERKPSSWRLEQYVDGEKMIALLRKLPRGLKGWEVHILGGENQALILRYGTRKQAILAFKEMRPLREDEDEQTA